LPPAAAERSYEYQITKSADLPLESREMNAIGEILLLLLPRLSRAPYSIEKHFNHGAKKILEE
jgi:hypothetical protein